MLFSSYLFLITFLPLSLLIYFLSSKVHVFLGLLSIVIASSIFYGWHNPSALFLIYLSIFFNYVAARYILKTKEMPSQQRVIFFSSILFNVLLLVYFKYLNFLIVNFNCLFSTKFTAFNHPLPLAISFFTFQQIAFLVDVYKRHASIPRFFEYVSFITFFPQLIAGPIVNHEDYLPQIRKTKAFVFSLRNIGIGSTIFTIGLFKKVILADNAGLCADRVFQLAADGLFPTMYEAWLGVLSYSFQIYFDFSGYSDMALGLARMFNIQLPINFFSPYKSTSVIEFWRRWHISLSIFLREHIYIPLGGNRKSPLSRYRNLAITMLIGGLWHGASWTFVVWGGLHGLYLIINHLLRNLKQSRTHAYSNTYKCLFTFILVSVTWIFFRASNFSEAKIMLSSLFDFQSLGLSKHLVAAAGKYGLDLSPFQGSFLLSSFARKQGIQLITIMSVIVFCVPNVYEWMKFFMPAKDYPKKPYFRNRFSRRFFWRPTLTFSTLIIVMLIYAFGNINAKNEFIYFQF